MVDCRIYKAGEQCVANCLMAIGRTSRSALVCCRDAAGSGSKIAMRSRILGHLFPVIIAGLERVWGS
jgi:hypothetical protein